MNKEKVIIEVTEVLSPSSYTGLIDFNLKCYLLDMFLKNYGEKGRDELIENLDRLKDEVEEHYKNVKDNGK